MSYLFGYTPEERIKAVADGEFALNLDSQQSQNLVFWSPLGLLDGLTDYDYSGYRNHGTRINGPTPTPVNHPQWGSVRALDFDGVNDNVLWSTNPLAGLSVFTVSLSAVADTLGTASRLVSNGASDDFELLVSGTGIHNCPAGNLGLFIRNSTSGLIQDFGDVSSLATFGVITATCENNSQVSYLNGNQIASKTYGFVSSDIDGVLRVGRRFDNGSAEWDGKINDPRIYNIAKTAEQVAEIAREPWNIGEPVGIRSFAFFGAAAAGGPFPVVGPLCLAAVDVFFPGLKAGANYKPGMQKGETFNPGVQVGQGVC